jgi:hypothetical protein
MTLCYKDLLELCCIEDESDFGGYVVKKTGVYVKKYKKHAWNLLTPSEKDVLAWHPTMEYDKPALALPCTLEELRAFVSDAGLAGCIDEEAEDEMLANIPRFPDNDQDKAGPSEADDIAG